MTPMILEQCQQENETVNMIQAYCESVLKQKELCRPLKEVGCMIVLDSAWSDMLSLDGNMCY